MRNSMEQELRIKGKRYRNRQTDVVQLDSETISEHEDTWVWDVMEIVESMFGAENIVGFSVHRDETNVHLHILFVPCLKK